MNYETKDTILSLNNVELGYGINGDYKCILKNVNLIEHDIVREGYITGQVIAVVGRSGRGKSTLFKALTGLVKPRSGSVMISEFDPTMPQNAKLVHEGDVGYVDQKYTLFRHKTVYKALIDAQRKSKITLAEKKEIAETYLNSWGLWNQKNQYPCELSGGQRQRTAIIEQILSSGHFMVLDEPYSGLDVGNVNSAKEAFKLIQNDHELNTIIYSTHDMNLAVELADSIYVVGHKDGNSEYSTIVQHFDLKKLGLAWREFGQEHLDFVKELTNVLMNS